MSRFAEEVDKSLKESEERMTREFNSQIEFSVNEMQISIEQCCRELEDKM